jgi:hypothetical protein
VTARREIDPQPTTCTTTSMEGSSAGGVSSTPLPATVDAMPNARTRVEEWEALSFPVTILAETVNDIETIRIGISHRVAGARRAGADDDELETLVALLELQTAVEKQAVKSLEKAMKQHPLAPWVAQAKGVGLKQSARLLAAIGNPYWNHAADRPRRGPAELWAYCGLHVLPAGHLPVDAQESNVGGQLCHPDDQNIFGSQAVHVAGVAPRRAKGERANWNSAARMRARLVAESCVKQDSSSLYRLVYEDGRKKYADAVHAVDCPQCGMCGTCGKPPGLGRQEHEATGCSERKVVKATVGTPLRDGHKHARALRLVSKEVLKDLFLAARDWHLAE